MNPKQQAILDWIRAKSDEAATEAIIALADVIDVPPTLDPYPYGDESEAYDGATD